MTSVFSNEIYIDYIRFFLRNEVYIYDISGFFLTGHLHL